MYILSKGKDHMKALLTHNHTPFHPGLDISITRISLWQFKGKAVFDPQQSQLSFQRAPNGNIVTTLGPPSLLTMRKI
jgi:hypothetical protein